MLQFVYSSCPYMYIYINIQLLIMQLCHMCDYCTCICVYVLYCKSDFIYNHFILASLLMLSFYTCMYCTYYVFTFPHQWGFK